MQNNFQIITIVVFIAFAVFGIMVFSGAIDLGGDGNNNQGAGTVTLWGTIDSAPMLEVLEDFNRENPTFSVNYVRKSPETFDQELLEAIASGRGPDFFLLPSELAYDYSNRIIKIPYESYPLSTFKNTFAGAGEVFLSSQGILAFPLLIDPLMLYYNRGMLDAEGITAPPAYWDEFNTNAKMLTKRDESNKIEKSGAGLGHYSNVLHAKDILATLFMQAGSPIVKEEKGVFVSALVNASANYDLATVLEFYTDFANPLKDTYSWNKSFPSSMDAFSAENLAFYFGYASELAPLINKNPNQNFSVAGVPQIRGANFKVTNARVLGVAISNFSKNSNTAFIAASKMATSDFTSKLAQALGIAPARRDLLAQKPADAYSPIFYNSALYGKSWLDPSDSDTEDIFRAMIDNVLSGNMTARNAIQDASSRMRLLLLP